MITDLQKTMNKEIPCACGCGGSLTPKDKYYRSRSYLSGHNGRKYDDPTQHKREWNKRNKRQRAEYRKNTRHTRKAFLVVYAGGICTDCEAIYDGTNACMFDFHHIGEKLFGVSGNVMEKSMDKLRAEVDKCILLCGNCHRKRHSEGY